MTVRTVLVFGLLLPVGFVQSAEQSAVKANDTKEPKTARVPDAEFLLMGDRGTTSQIAIHVEIEGRPLKSIWKKAFQRLFKYHDRNDDQHLGPQEAQRLPSPFALRQILWDPVSQFSGRLSNWKKLDDDGDGKTSYEEMAGYYGKHGIGGVTIGVGQSPADDDLTEALLRPLDSNGDGFLTATEAEPAPQVLGQLDSNGDELLTPEELVPRLTYPGTAGNRLWKPSQQQPPIPNLPLRLLPHARKSGKRDSSDRPIPAVAERNQVNLKIRFTTSETPRQFFADNGIDLSIRKDPGKLQEQTNARIERVRQGFRGADHNADNKLNRSEVDKKDQSDLRFLLDAADRNADNRLTWNELNAWIRLQKQLAGAHVLISVLDLGRGLFEPLDANEDGRLSLREQQEIPRRLQTLKPQTQSRFDPRHLSRTLRIIVSRGQPKHLLAPIAYQAPAWFKALDRNQDGDVSRREFIGSTRQFRRFDRNRDGFIAPNESLPHAEK